MPAAVTSKGEGTAAAPESPWTIAFSVTSGMVKESTFTTALAALELPESEVGPLASLYPLHAACGHRLSLQLVPPPRRLPWQRGVHC
eukprot:SAG22_NODE_2188_length_2865_cov_5.442878_4_plen_87_part_00